MYTQLRRFGFVFATLVSSVSAQSTWLNLSPLRSPSARYYHCMAYDANRGVVVMFGGQTSSSRMSDTWEWDGYLWTQRTPTTRPPARSQAAMVYDTQRKKVLLFGGYNGQSSFADTWEWDGIVWEKLSTTSAPSPRFGHAMSYDTARGVAVLFAGYASSGGELQDTWEWNGTTWIDRKIPTTLSPQRRTLHSMAYHAGRKLTLLTGGTGSSYAWSTWQWDGQTWTSQNSSGSRDHAMAYDDARRVVLRFGGGSSPFSNDQQEWDGAGWSSLNTKVTPPARGRHTMSYDSRRRRMVVFSGSGSGGGDTWELVHDCVCVGDGHPGGGLPITCLTPPVLGSQFRVAFSSSLGVGTLYVGAPSSVPFLQLQPPIVCVTGTLYPIPLLAIPVTGKPAIFEALIPYVSQLRGSRVVLQAATPEIFGCFRLTDAVEATIR